MKLNKLHSGIAGIVVFKSLPVISLEDRISKKSKKKTKSRKKNKRR